MSDIDEEEEIEEPVQKVRSKRVFFNHIDSYCGKNIAKVCKFVPISIYVVIEKQNFVPLS